MVKELVKPFLSLVMSFGTVKEEKQLALQMLFSVQTVKASHSEHLNVLQVRTKSLNLNQKRMIVS